MDIKEFDDLLRKHDWSYRQSDTSEFYKRGQQEAAQLETASRTSANHAVLYQAYKGAYGVSKSEAKATNAFEKLDRTRVKLGVLSAQELAAQEARRQQHRTAEEEKHLAALRAYDHLCAVHNWFYWHEPVESTSYAAGFNERVELTRQVSTLEWKQGEPHTRLFRAWAAYKNASGEQARLRREEIYALRVELKLIDA